MGTDNTRRDFLKAIGGATGAGALGSLAGCTGGTGGDGDDGGDGGGSGGGGGSGSDGGGGSAESVEIRFLTGLGAENPRTKSFYQESMKRFEGMKGNVAVNLEFISNADIKEKMASTVKAGNPPNLAQVGSLGIQFWSDGEVVDHGSYIEESGIADNWSDVNIESAKFRGEWWSGGSNISVNWLLGVRPTFFKDAGVDDPSVFETWSGFRGALESVAETFPDVFAYEESGAWNDLETYWSQAQTAYTDGMDPWFRGEEPWNDLEGSLQVGRDGRTDGMIINCIDVANEFSSADAPSRVDEDIPSMMLADRAASYMSAIGNTARWQAIKEDVTFGWDGDLYTTPIPKLDPDYGDEYDIPALSGHDGEHGGTSQTMQNQKQIFEIGNEDLAWDLNYYVHTDPNHGVRFFGEVYQTIPTYLPHIDQIKRDYEGDISAHFQAALNAIDTYSVNYHPCGASWDLRATDEIRWQAMNETISEAMAGQHRRDRVVSTIRERMLAAAKAGEGQ